MTVDPGTASALREHQERWEARCAAAEAAALPDAFVFSLDPAGESSLKPSSVTQRYGRMARRLNIDTHLHNLRHYSATELIAAGVDVRTVAGRLGHGSGGTTTLRVYAAWVAEADQRAAQGLTSRLPPMPTAADVAERVWVDPRLPYEQVAADLRRRIVAGELAVGSTLPTGKQLAAEFGVSIGTAQRAVTALRELGLVAVSRGVRPVVVDRPDFTQTPPSAP